jgi:hypothetical protein
MAMPKSRKPKTHFEQVPLETLKDIIAVEEAPDHEADGNKTTIKTPAKQK